MSSVKIVVEQHADGFVAYPVGMRGVIVGEGATADEALADVKSAIGFHVETFGGDALADDDLLSAFITEAEVVV
jgi:predicted RNase H-like HicB family nuclease